MSEAAPTEAPATARIEAPHLVPVHHSPRAGRRAIILGVCVPIGLLLILLFRHVSTGGARSHLPADASAGTARPRDVDVVRVETASGNRRLTLPGEARPYRDSTIFARTSGYLSNYFVDIGDQAKKGQVLATIETPELDDRIAAARAKVQELQAEVHVAETGAAFAGTSFDRWERATQDGSVSVQERDQKQSELASGLAKVEAAKASVALAEADLRGLLTLDKFKTVTAPYDGTITDRQIDLGDLVTAGSTSNTTLLFGIAQFDQVRVMVDVPQSVAADIATGGTATVRFGDRDVVGRVDRTTSRINQTSRTLRVEVLVPNAQHTLLPGTYLQVTFDFKRLNATLRVPSSALIWRTGGPQLAIVDDNGKVSFRDVKIVRDSGDVVEIAGVEAGVRVALNISNEISDGDVVTARETESALPATKPAG